MVALAPKTRSHDRRGTFESGRYCREYVNYRVFIAKIGLSDIRAYF